MSEVQRKSLSEMQKEYKIWTEKANALLWINFGHLIVECPICGDPKLEGYVHCEDRCVNKNK